ncbi:hypothetical protein CHUAL_006571 [Chamberlinius hualienensis]
MNCFNILILAVAIASVAARPSGYGNSAPAQYALAQPQYGNAVGAPEAYEEPYEERNYKVYYSVKDDPSYNLQTRQEEKNGNTVTGQYTVLEPTGELRVVNYVADENGFRADVQNQAGYAQPAPIQQQQQPTYARVQAPKGY